MTNNNYVAIMAGGIGSRFWPMSRTDFPKQFLDIYNLINCLKENENCLDSLTYTTSKNQARKINKTCIKNIKEFFL